MQTLGEPQNFKLTMMSVFLLSTVIATLLMSGIKAQSSPLADLADCAELRKQLEFRKIRLFTNAQGTDGVQDVICLDEQLGLVRYFHCQDGFTAVVRNDPGNFFTVVDVAELRRQLNIRDVLICQHPGTSQTTLQPPPSVGSCLTAGLMPKAHQFLYRDRNVICERSCSVATSALGGRSTGSKVRTFITCCNGDQPRIISQTSRIYTCTL